MNWSNLLDSLRRALRWHRRLIAACLAGLAVYFALAAAAERDDTERVLVAARAVEAGGTLTAADLTTLEVPRAAVPDEALTEPDAAIGEAVIVRIPARAVLTASALASGDRLVAAGRVALPITLADSAPAGLIRPGDRIDLLGPGGSGAIEALASGVRVVTVSQPDAGLFGGELPVLLVDVDRDQAARLVAAGVPLSFALS